MSCARLYACRAYRDPGGPRKEKESSKTSKEEMREHEQAKFIKYN